MYDFIISWFRDNFYFRETDRPDPRHLLWHLNDFYFFTESYFFYLVRLISFICKFRLNLKYLATFRKNSSCPNIWIFIRLHSAVCTTVSLVIFTQLEILALQVYMFRNVGRNYLYKPSWKSEGLLNSSGWKWKQCENPLRYCLKQSAIKDSFDNMATQMTAWK